MASITATTTTTTTPLTNMKLKNALQPRGLNHHAFPTLNMDETHKFWTEVMGCDFLGAFSFLEDPAAKGLPDKYIHSLYGMSDGSAMAFFELMDGYEKKDDGIPKSLKHVALACDSNEQVRGWHRHFEAHGLKVNGEIDHEGIWLSIYVEDPNGLVVEITHQGYKFEQTDADEGMRALREWRSIKTARHNNGGITA